MKGTDSVTVVDLVLLVFDDFLAHISVRVDALTTVRPETRVAVLNAAPTSISSLDSVVVSLGMVLG